ncbi:MAG: class I SAM-dependent methyltransferase [Usitatibacter sp.]
MKGKRIKLNLGCGSRHFEGFVNVDKYGEPDVRHDLEVFPWPWADSSVEEIRLLHVLEHLGRDPDVFIGIMKEMYRVCANGARVQIVVPHPRHDDFLGDPTHVRPVTIQVLTLFDRSACDEWQRQGFANTPLALYHHVDFRVLTHVLVPDEPYRMLLEQKKITFAELERTARSNNNVVSEIHFELEVRK